MYDAHLLTQGRGAGMARLSRPDFIGAPIRRGFFVVQTETEDETPAGADLLAAHA